MQTMIRQENRTEQILLSLKRLDYLTRSQIQRLHGLGSYRNTTRVLKEMEPYLSGFRDQEKIYYLNKEGRARIGCNKIRKKTNQAQHFIMRNELFLAVGRPSTWQNEMKLQAGNVTVICDAMFKRGKKYCFVEVDHTQKMIQNQKKIERYKELIGLGAFDVLPEIIWITTTEYRRKALLKAMEGMYGVRVYTIEDLR